MTFPRLWTLTLCCWLMAGSTADAQTRKPAQQKARTTQNRQAKAQPKKTQTKTSTAKKQPAKGQTATQPTTVKGLQNQRQQVQKQLKEQQRRLEQNRKNVKQRLQNLQMLNTEIADKKRTIDTIRHDIDSLDVNISALGVQLKSLEERLRQRRDNYVKAMRYMHRNRSLQNQLVFIFSAQNFTQMYRRLRFTREYAQYQRAQGEGVHIVMEEVRLAREELTDRKRQKSALLTRDEQERRQLESKQEEQQKVVKTLQREQKTIEGIITEQQKKDAALNARIEKLIAEEIARAKARAEAEARAEAQRKARQAAEAEARRRAEQRSRDGKATGSTRREREERQPDVKVEKADFSVSTEDRRLSGNFESNRGRLPMPLTGSYRVVSGFGQNSVDGLKGVHLDNKGMNIKGQAGAQARSIFDGEVCAVFDIRGVMGVMVRHGSYISVYSNLSSVSVRRGQKVSTRQTLGTLGAEGILHFELRNGSAAQNPARWLAR